MLSDYLELAAVLLGLDPAFVEDWDAVEEQFEDKYGIAMGEIEDLLDDLLKLTVPQRNGLRGEWYQFFGAEDPNTPGVWTAVLRRQYQPKRVKEESQ